MTTLSAGTESAYIRALTGLLGDRAPRDADVIPAAVEAGTPGRVAAHLAELAAGGASTSALRRVRSAVDWAFAQAGRRSPTGSPEVEAAWTGVLRVARGESPPDAVTVTASRAPDLVRMARSAWESRDEPSGAHPPFAAVRDALLLIVGGATRLRAPELVALTYDDIVPEGGGVSVRLPEGRWVTVETTAPAPPPTEALAEVRVAVSAAYLDPGGPSPIFVASDRWDVPRGRPIGKSDVTRIVRRWAERAGLSGAGTYGAPWLGRSVHGPT